MHDAPSVSYPVGRSSFAGALLATAWLLGAAALLAWRLSAPVSTGRLAAALCISGVAALAAGWAWSRSPTGEIVWNGESWAWMQAGASWPGELHVALDLQRWLLVRRQANTGPAWLWLVRASRPECWDELRRAVYSRARPDALPVALPPAAKP